MGVWHPENAVLKDVRAAIVQDPEGWQQAIGDPPFATRFQLAGDSLKRPPRGTDPDHPCLEDLKRKDFMAVTRFGQDEALRPDFLPWLAQTWDTGRGFMTFLSRAMDVPF